MTRVSAQALELAGQLYAAWPAFPNIPAASITLAAEDLDRAGLDIAGEVVDRLRTYPAPVSHGEILDVARRVRLERYEALNAQKALPGPTEDEWTAAHEGFREQVERLRAKWAAEDEPEPAGVESRAKREPMGEPYRGCNGAGKRVVHRDGHVFCPDCGEDVCRTCVPTPRSSRSGAG